MPLLHGLFPANFRMKRFLFLGIALMGISVISVYGESSRTVMGGDLLRIAVDESPELDGVYPVAGDGNIDFNFAGRIHVEGISLDELAVELQSILEKSYFKKATVHVGISEYVVGSVLILGAVEKPGSISYKGNEVMTVLEAIIAAGGLTDRAASDKVKIFRWKTGGSMSREVVEVNLKRMLNDYDFTNDEYLRPRDIVVVPQMGQDDAVSEFLALGEFGQTGFHPAVDNMNMIRAISIAGGVTREAHLESARLLRPTGDGNYNVIPVDLARLLGSADMRMNISVYPGDVIYLPSASQTSGGKVYFLGEIDNPGMYPLPVNAAEATLARSVLARGGLAKFSNGSAVKIQRKAPDGSTQTLTIDVDKILKSGNFDLDVPLQDNDVIIIPQKLFSF